MKQPWFVLILLMSLFVACGNDPGPAVPTRLPAAELPTEPPPSPTPLPPTRDLSTATPEPATAVPEPPALPVTAVPTPVEARLSLSAPDNGAQLLLGSDIVVRGLAQLDATHSVSVTLFSPTGHILSSATGVVNAVGWEAGLQVPENISGAATLRANVVDGNGNVLAQDSATVNLVLDAAASDRYLALYNPVEGDTAVAGYFLFFDGRAQQPVGSRITIALWMDECQTQVASFTLTMEGSGYWQGQLGIPANVAGPGCAIASFGTPGEAAWREVQIPINVLAADSEEATGVTIINPAAGSAFPSGQTLYLSGTAFNAARVQVSVLLENGRIVGETSAVPNSLGLWEAELLLPFDVAGPAEITVVAQDASSAPLAETRRVMTITLGPTPTPQS